MGQHTVVVIPHDYADNIKGDASFGERLWGAICARSNVNIPQRAVGAHSVELGPRFHTNDSLFVLIKEGSVEKLSCEEQLHLEESLRRLRKKKKREICLATLG